jgi:O-antigen/teichoic acid export membrane protein
MLGMMNGLPRFVARMQADPSSDAVSQAALAIAVIAVGMAVALLSLMVIPTDLLGLTDDKYSGILMALTFSIGLNNVLIGINNGLENFNHVSFGAFAMGVVLVGGSVSAIAFGASHWIVLFYLAATFVSSVILVRRPLQVFRERLAEKSIIPAYRNLRAVWVYVGPMFFATLLTNTGLWLAGRSLLNHEEGAQFFAEYALGLQWFGLAHMASNVVSKAALPRVTQSIFFGDSDARRATMRVSIWMSLIGALVVLSAVVALHPFILSLYGPDMTGARWSLILFVAAGVIASPIPALGNVLIAEGRYCAFLASTAAWWSTIVAGTFLYTLTPGVAIYFVVLLSYSVFLICRAAFVFRISR